VYVYIGYPLILLAISVWDKWRKRPSSEVPAEPETWPSVSILVPAYNEECVILEKLRNFLALDYPADRLELIIGSDGSTDGTVGLVEEFGHPRIRLVRFPIRSGKTSVLNQLVPAATGDIIVFSDANTMYEPRAVRELARPFTDPKVGGVCGRLILRAASYETISESKYWQFEQYLKRIEGQRGSVLGGTGGIYAIRREIYRQIPPTTIVDDFVIGLGVLQQNYRMVFANEARASEVTARNLRSEFERRARIGAGDFQALTWTLDLLLPSRGFVAFSYLSHKVLRWFMPFSCIGLTVSAFSLIHQPFYLWVSLGIVMVAVMAWIGWLLNKHEHALSVPFRVPYYFILMNAALLTGAIRYVRKSQPAAWQRTERIPTPTAAQTIPRQE